MKMDSHKKRFLIFLMMCKQLKRIQHSGAAEKRGNGLQNKVHCKLWKDNSEVEEMKKATSFILIASQKGEDGYNFISF